MSKFWLEYRKVAYDLILESESETTIHLDNEVEVYVVHLFANCFNRTDIGDIPIALQMLTVMQGNKNYQPIADECLLIHSFPFRKHKWPSDTYYKDMGQMAYKMANLDTMERNFEPASRILSAVFRRII
jgi:hypothetical protein